MKKFHQESRVLRTRELCRGTIRRLIKTERATRYQTVSTVFISFRIIPIRQRIGETHAAAFSGRRVFRYFSSDASRASQPWAISR